MNNKKNTDCRTWATNKKLNCGIYKITNLNNGKIYIGKSKNLMGRLGSHRAQLLTGKSIIKGLQKDFNDNTDTRIIFEVILLCEPSEIHKYEKEIIRKFKPQYNEITYSSGIIWENFKLLL